MPTTPTPPYDPRNPLAAEEAELPSVKMGEEHAKKKNESFTKHLASELRKAHPDIQADATDEEVFSAVHSVEVPEATPEEYWEGLKTTYGYSWKPPSDPNIVQQGAAFVGDLATSIVQDVTAIPKGAVELGQGMGKIAAGEMQGMKTAAFTGMSQGPSTELQEGLDLVDKAKAHFARGGAFAAGSLAAMVTGGIVSPLTAKLGLAGVGAPIIKRLLGNALVGGADAASFMGVYGGIREGAETGASPGEAWHEFVEGTKQGAILGVGIGVGGTLAAPVISKAWKAGVAAAEANTLGKAKAASIKFSDAFMPEWVPPEMATMDPAEFAIKLITETHGKDVADSQTGAKAASIIAEKIASYRKLTSAAGPKVTPTGSPVPATVPVETPTGDIRWDVMIEEKPGVTGLYNVNAPTIEVAKKAADDLATKVGGKVKTEITPSPEKRDIDRRARFAGPPGGTAERRAGDRRGAPSASTEQIEKIGKESRGGLVVLDKLNREQLIQFYHNYFPGRTKLPYEGTRELRNYLKRELKSLVKAVDEMNAPVVKEKVKATPTKALVAEVKTAPVEKKAAIADELRTRAPEEIGIVEEVKDATWVPAATKVPEGKPKKANRAATKAPPAKMKAPPGQTFLIGRGQNGQVRVAFPTKDLADLYALLGRLRGNVKTGKSRYSATTAAREADRLAKVHGVTRAQLWDLATLYRTQVNEFVKGHKTYEETGEILVGPDLKTLHETTDPDLIRRMAKAKQEGGVVDRQDLTALGRGVTDEIKRLSREKLHKVYRGGIENGAVIKDWKIVDLFDEFSPEMLDDISKTASYEPFLKTLQTLFTQLQGELEKISKAYRSAEFTGFSTHDHYGANLEKVITGSKRNHILVNPWSTLDEVLIRVKQGLVEDTPAAIADDTAGQLASTLLHELSHQEAKSEAAVAGVYTRNVGYFIDALPKIKAAIAKQLKKGKVLSDLRRHRDDLFLEKASKKQKDTEIPEITAKEAEIDITDYLPIQELGLEEIDIS